MNIKFKTEELKEALQKHTQKAKDYLNDDEKMENFLQRLERKLNLVPKIGNQLADIVTLISLVRSYMKKQYTDIPIGSMISIVAALIYFVSPIDIIPDTVPIIGYMDDIAVIGFVLNFVHDDVEEYKKWQKENNKRI